jgi:tetratricopeptide (TPR) repeat protein
LIYLELGELCVDAGRTQEAEAAYGAALAVNAQIEQRFQDIKFHYRRLDDSDLNRMAWKLATHVGAQPDHGARAVDYAKRAVAVAPQVGAWWNTLGAAHYRTGSCKDAIAALEKSMSLRQGGDSYDWFFLAMAHWQLGEKAQARKWYNQAVAWMDKNRPKDEELLRFRAEAAALLGEPEPAPPPKLVEETSGSPAPHGGNARRP